MVSSKIESCFSCVKQTFIRRLRSVHASVVLILDAFVVGYCTIEPSFNREEKRQIDLRCRKDISLEMSCL